MATWITDRTQADVDRVKELTAKARSGTWTEEEQQEWASGMKGALSYTDYARIEQGMKELADIVGAKLPIDPISVVTALNTSGEIPAWDTYPSKSEFFMPLTAKKAGLLLRSLEFRVKGYMPGKMRTVLRKYGTTTALADKSIDLVRGYNDVVLDMGSIALEKGVEYQLYFAAANNFYPPSVDSSWVAANDCIDIAHGSAYYGDDTKMIFSGTITFTGTSTPEWGPNSYLTTEDANRWIASVKAIRSKCSGTSFTPDVPKSLSMKFGVINQVEKILSDIESIAKDYTLYCSEPICGGEPYYAVY
jgi:hypothetical protein|nr:MAG TPA: hypothetical protein [Caudoviricetes sp.]